MASSMPSLDQTPPQPPDITAQQGQSPYSGVSSMMQQQQGQQQGGAPDPKGALVAQSDAVKKVVDQMAKMEPAFAPFADRIKSLLDAGLGAAISGGGPGGSSQQSQPPVMGPNSMRPSAPGSGFPG